jgi:hypothetical protein
MLLENITTNEGLDVINNVKDTERHLGHVIGRRSWTKFVLVKSRHWGGMT